MSVDSRTWPGFDLYIQLLQRDLPRYQIVNMTEPESGPTPAPILFDPSQEFDGNDGKWSTFVIRLGTPEQDFRILPSPAIGGSIVPVPEGCIASDPPDCGALRGAYPFKGHASHGLLLNESSTWNEIGLYDVNLRKELNISVNGLYGLDNVGLTIQTQGGLHYLSKLLLALRRKTST